MPAHSPHRGVSQRERIRSSALPDRLRYQHASLILTSTLPVFGWVGVFGDRAVAAEMIDRKIHHADVPTLKGASYLLRGRGIDSSIHTTTDETAGPSPAVAGVGGTVGDPLPAADGVTRHIHRTADGCRTRSGAIVRR